MTQLHMEKISRTTTSLTPRHHVPICSCKSQIVSLRDVGARPDLQAANDQEKHGGTKLPAMPPSAFEDFKMALVSALQAIESICIGIALHVLTEVEHAVR